MPQGWACSESFTIHPASLDNLQLRYLSVVLILILYAAFCYGCWFRYQRQHGNKFVAVVSDKTSTWLIAFASQTGQAEKIAEQTAQQLQQAEVAVNLLPLNKVNLAELTKYQRVLFIVSTYGEGEAPDNGGGFIRRVHALDLSALKYAVLALGDTDYAHFCAFGHELNHALHASGAQSSCDLIEVDKCDDGALRHWQYYLGQLSGYTAFTDWSKPGYEKWQLCERRFLNPGSAGAPVYFLRLKPAQASVEATQWIAGDIAEIGPHNDPGLPHREYSIASTPAKGTLDLLVRQVRKESGELGLGSGWLTQVAAEGSEICLRIRRNTRFHPPADNVPMILIGNGTGIAGLRAHLLARVERGVKQNWLLFGERNLTQDFHFRDELTYWRDTGMLQRLDVVFSREQLVLPSPRYVQDLLPLAEEELRLWVARGAAIYVCGSLHGMAQGVDEALEVILGREKLEFMAENQRYCRDVY